VILRAGEETAGWSLWRADDAYSKGNTRRRNDATAHPRLRRRMLTDLRTSSPDPADAGRARSRAARGGRDSRRPAHGAGSDHEGRTMITISTVPSNTWCAGWWCVEDPDPAPDQVGRLDGGVLAVLVAQRAVEHPLDVDDVLLDLEVRRRRLEEVDHDALGPVGLGQDGAPDVDVVAERPGEAHGAQVRDQGALADDLAAPGVRVGKRGRHVELLRRLLAQLVFAVV
jgi:hypothetical protein